MNVDRNVPFDTASCPRRRVVLQFYAGSEQPDWTVHVCSADSLRGEVRERDEGPVRWFDAEEIPYDKM